jgi:hypothetical protein
MGNWACSCPQVNGVSLRKSKYESLRQHASKVEVTLRLTRYYFLSECCCLKLALVSLWGALSDERTGLQFAVQSPNGPSRAEPVTILYCLI